jgi:hypothetical protein
MNMKYIPEDAIAQQYRFADKISNQNWAPTWSGVLAAGLGGFGGGMHRSSAQNAIEGNQSMMAQALKNAGQAPTLDAATNALVDSGVPDLQKSGVEQRMKKLGDDPNKEYRVRADQWKQMGYAPETEGYKEFVLTGKLPGADGSSNKYGLNPVYGVDAEGNPVVMQLNTGGGAQPVKMPEGVTVSKNPIKMDAGTHFVLLDPVTRQTIGTVPKDLAGAEAAKAEGEAAGKARASAPSDIAAADTALELVESIRSDPNREAGTGLSSVQNYVRSTPGYDFQTKVDQAKSGAFLTAIQQMRGMGALSNAEGETATKAVTRMNTATSEGEFLAALADYEKLVNKARATAQKRLQPQAPAASPQVTPTAPADDIPTVNTPEEAAALPSGTRFRDPTGKIRMVP